MVEDERVEVVVVQPYSITCFYYTTTLFVQNGTKVISRLPCHSTLIASKQFLPLCYTAFYTAMCMYNLSLSLPNSSLIKREDHERGQEQKFYT